MGAAIEVFFVETIIPALVAVGEAIMGFLEAVADAMADTIFGSPLAVGILAGVAGIAVALAALGAVKFAHGGIVTGPTLGLMGEAGSPEAAIPLNDRGAAFMAHMLGMTNQPQQETEIHTHVYLDGRQIAVASSSYLPSALRQMGLPA
jgi:hypothetical protein